MQVIWDREEGVKYIFNPNICYVTCLLKSYGYLPQKNPENIPVLFRSLCYLLRSLCYLLRSYAIELLFRTK